MNRVRAFILIELLVVIAVLSLLAWLLLPVFDRVRKASEQTKCVSNLRQVAVGVNAYAADSNGYLPPSGNAALDQSSGDGKCWKAYVAEQLGTSVNPYNLEHGIFHCPSQRNQTCGNAGYGDKGFYGGYGWNFMYLGWRPNEAYAFRVKITQVAYPAETVMVIDTADAPSQPHTAFYSYPFLDALPTRHKDGGNVLWVDGHASWHSKRELYVHKSEWWDLK